MCLNCATSTVCPEHLRIEARDVYALRLVTCLCHLLVRMPQM
jgi:hypothetical protein